MKKRTILGSVMLAGALLIHPLAGAELIVNRVDVPFSFVVNGRTMPAGTYNIQRTDGAHNILLIHNLNTNKLATTLSSMENTNEQSSRLTFEDVAGQHILRSVRVPGVVFSWAPTKAEKRLAQANKTTDVNQQQ